MSRARQMVRHIVRRNLQDASALLELYAPYEFLLREERDLRDFLSTKPTLEDCTKTIEQYRAARDDIQAGLGAPDELPLDLILVECGSMNRSLLGAADALIGMVLEYVEEWCVSAYQDISRRYGALTSRLLHPPGSSIDLVRGETSLEAAIS